MTLDEFIELHQGCPNGASFSRDMERSGIWDYWYDAVGDIWNYRYPNSKQIRQFKPSCNHPEHGYCGRYPSQELLEKLSRKSGRPKKEPMVDRMSEEEVAEVLDKAIAIQ